MKQTFDQHTSTCALAKLKEHNDKLPMAKDETRSPVHVVYGGAHLFKAGTVQKLAKIAVQSLHEYAPTAADLQDVLQLNRRVADQVFDRIVKKLTTEAVEDFRIDFEDGYGFRRDDEEDADAIASSNELAAAFEQKTISPFCGFRIKSLQTETSARRAVRTLDLFLTNLLEKTGGQLPANFVVTLPKVENPKQVAVLVELLESFERAALLSEKSLKLEILIETPTAIVNNRGEIGLRKLVEAADGRCVAAHFGAYDFTSAFGITAEHQNLSHPLCNFARTWMQVALAPLRIRLSDSVTTLMPVPIHKGENLTESQINENRLAVWRGWSEHFNNVSNSLSQGFYQSWDLHPNQLVARYAAVYAFFFDSFDSSAERLRGFLDKATKASLTGNQFDDAASANGLLNFFARGLNCGAFEEHKVLEATNLSLEELRSGSFAKIAEQKQSL